ncbi:secreted RxLR effector protein 161-like [Solenopsis invicta]|uniref:secreted RxLR effector protein 161-like n=1 Tax=Solenopsis invicta TaxID=13686 RepID=UPI00193D3CB8|nr:secreted RxLR effector protein 161-like [Solenopsis invicta]
MDVKGAFLNGKLIEKIYIEQPEGFKNERTTKIWHEQLKSVSTPMETGLKLKKGNQDESKALTTRPDLSAGTNYFSQYQNCYTNEHFTHAKRILRYISGTINTKMTFCKGNSNNILTGFTDADWANDMEERKSITGYIFEVYGNTVNWASRKQSTISFSLTESEYAALEEGICEAKWIRGLLKEIGHICKSSTTIYIDNQLTFKVDEHPVLIEE